MYGGSLTEDMVEKLWDRHVPYNGDDGGCTCNEKDFRCLWDEVCELWDGCRAEWRRLASCGTVSKGLLFLRLGERTGIAGSS